MRFGGQSALKLHGGIGVAGECRVSHRFKKFAPLEMRYGDSSRYLGEVPKRT